MHLPIKRVSKDNIKAVFSFQLLFPSELQGSGSPITVYIDPGFINLVQQRVAQLYVLLVSSTHNINHLPKRTEQVDSAPSGAPI